ncbi:MAG TPA: hypothetical protein PKZ60_02380 [Candidatus Saccharicenans sp.]|jgi:hypothetical protein|nr:hypothetical protein [Candidatus Saccharicenans sp.]
MSKLDWIELKPIYRLLTFKQALMFLNRKFETFKEAGGKDEIAGLERGVL